MPLSLTDTQLLLLLVLATGLVAFSGRRLGVLGLAVQFMLCTLLSSGVMLPTILIARLVLGLSASLILYLSASWLARAQRGQQEDRPRRFERMGSLYGLLCVVLAGFVAAGLYRSLPLPGLSPTIVLTSYWLVLSGLLLTTIESSVLGQGLAVLTALNGFEVAFFQLETGLLMLGMFSLLEIGLVLMIAILSDQQIQDLGGEAD